MTDPIRLLDGGEELSVAERRVLEADLGYSSPHGAKRAVWGAFGIEVTALGATAQAATSGATTLTALSLVKFAGIGVALGTLVSIAVFLAAPRENAPPSSVVTPTRSAAPSASAPRATATPARDVAPAHSGHEAAAPPNPGVPVRPENSASESDGAEQPTLVAETESQRVARARAYLRLGDARRALEELRFLEQDEPRGLLVQEREALLIEALSAVGQRESARERAKVFLKRYPSSPHVRAIERATE